MDKTDKAILNLINTAFPLEHRPNSLLARELGIPEQEVIERIKGMRESGIIRRIGATIDPRRLDWYSTLCAATIPEERIEEYARVANAYPEVTHNYVRTGHPNCWFTVIAPSKERAGEIIKEIKHKLGTAILELPARRVFKIGVRFTLDE
jgi:DNA-binding Lrp family transcriptional regulator